ncbi:hypothetical protein [Acetobacter cerevisiae]|uniref:hypothetical protein n=1 Tax=Acetobacter cerevisiae TaxID=178900 RepID=UPI00209F08A8|nr:hypothetical protein [Acetobacter cerevisiae]MCP1269994.1 hypothetical protein [Acetobacter cerevisiae]MCP1277948.1 hypothetical protein [Acetobacter cerevisiae]
MRLRYPVVLGLALSALIAPGERASGQSVDHAPQDAGAGTSAGVQAVSICVKPPPGAARDTLLVIPSGTVLVGQAVPAGRRQSAQMEAVVTTETVTLTEMQPCSGADASTLVSRTRHWLVDPVRPQAAVVLHPVGEVSGNGVDTSFEEEPDAFRSAVKTGAITAHVQGTLKETVALTETQADIPEEPDNSMGPDWAHSTGWDQNSLRKTPGSRTE